MLLIYYILIIIFNLYFFILETLIKCNTSDKMEDIINHFIIKIYKDNKIDFLYNGDKINENLKFYEQADENDYERKKLYILVCDNNENNNNNNKIIKTKYIICPLCKENTLFNIKDYKINVCKCKNNHSINNLSLREFAKTQIIDYSTIICDICQKESMANINNNEFYI